MPATITFKGKAETIFNPDGTPAYDLIKVPEIKTRHCNMDAFRRHPRLSGLANSTLFPAALKREFKVLGLGDYLRLDRLPNGVTVDASGFLASVTITIP